MAGALALALGGLGRSAVASGTDGPVAVFDGAGRGHGVGMSQDGAYWMARQGATARQILGHFYPGTTFARADGIVRVVVRDAAPGPVVVALPAGGVVRSPRSGRQAEGFPITVRPGGRVTIDFDGAYHVDDGTDPAERATTSTTPAGGTSTSTPATPGPTTSSTTTSTSTTSTTLAKPPLKLIANVRSAGASGAASSAAPVWISGTRAGLVALPAQAASYRGTLEVVDGGAGLRVLNELHVENYLRGMGEMPGSWPAAALQAQAIAARTYALRAMESNGEICADERCQVYLGAQAEDAGTDAAVRATAQQVLTFGGALAATVYSADAGGTSATPQEGFGTPDDAYPYLRATRYPTETHSPWEVRIGLDDLGRRLAYPARLERLRVTAVGGSGRAVTVRLEGDGGDLDVPAGEVASVAGLPSSRWTVSVTNAAVPAPPPTTVVGAGVLAPDAHQEVRAAAASVGTRHRRPVGKAEGDSGDYLLLLVPTGVAAATVLRRVRREAPSGVDPREVA